MTTHGVLSGIIASQSEDRIVVKVFHQPVEILHPAPDIVRRVQPVDNPEPFRRRRHQLHHALCPCVADRIRTPARFHRYDGQRQRW